LVKETDKNIAINQLHEIFMGNWSNFSNPYLYRLPSKFPYLLPKNRYMKILHSFLALLFLLFAAVQYNDPDPIQWMLFYGGVAAHFALAARGRMNRFAVWLWLLVAVGWAATLVPDFVSWLRMGEPSIVNTMKAETPWVELTREFLGLLIAAAGCGWLLWRTRTPANAII